MTAPAVVRVRMTVAYDGRGFHGFTPQPGGVETVGGALAEAVGRVLRSPVWPIVAGRTDTGVHAWGQVVTFDTPAEGLDLNRVQRSVNSQLGPRVIVRDIAVVPTEFDARRSAVARRYRYTVLNRPVLDPFLAATAWHVAQPLDLAALRLACDPVIGEHDFTSFCRPPRGALTFSMIRNVVEAQWLDVGDGVLRFEIEASSFCQQMVRAMVGTMVLMGTGKRRAGEMTSILRAQRRAEAARVAPPYGLCLWSVRYPDWTS